MAKKSWTVQLPPDKPKEKVYMLYVKALDKVLGNRGVLKERRAGGERRGKRCVTN